ncbi:hypothetical protein, partial [Neisseria sp. P0013.S004]|uniref:hypothetical protein n=1 Tax=Neisseria sp. P0013.S004 TaxID=3436740 RepID=UPI003F815C97
PGLSNHLNPPLALGDGERVTSNPKFNMILGSLSAAFAADLSATVYQPNATSVIAGNTNETRIKYGEAPPSGDTNHLIPNSKTHHHPTNSATSPTTTDAANAPQPKATQTTSQNQTPTTHTKTNSTKTHKQTNSNPHNTPNNTN